MINENFVENYYIRRYGQEELSVGHNFYDDFVVFIANTKVMVQPFLSNQTFDQFMVDHLLLEKRTYEEKQSIYNKKISEYSEKLMLLQQVYPYHDDMIDLGHDIENFRDLESFYYDMEIACDVFLGHLEDNTHTSLNS